MVVPLLLVTFFSALLLCYALSPRLLQIVGSILGGYLRRRTQSRRELLQARAVAEQRNLEDTASHTTVEDEWEKVDRSSDHSDDGSKSDDESKWNGIIGFFHPFCNAGGGGERVLWAAIKATQERWPKALCAVYTGDHEVTKEQILARVELHAPTVTFLYLTTRHYVLSTTWPYFTLLGQSVGSLVLAYNAFNLLVPDIFIDTMGYAFAMALSKFLFQQVPTGAYVHYPTISTDMLDSLDADSSSGHGLNAGSGRGLRGRLKQQYWRLFARLYGWVGGSTDVVMTNSSWTQDHVQKLWGLPRKARGKQYPIEVVFPPVAVDELEDGIEITQEYEQQRQRSMLYIAQFRPEKNHGLVLNAFGQFLKKNFSSALASVSGEQQKQKTSEEDVLKHVPKLTLMGSVRDTTDEKYIYSLRLLAHELRITDHVTFSLNAPWEAVLAQLSVSSVGVNGMWNEHFGIGVVEYQAAGLIGVVHDSGGPKQDIVVDMDDGPGGSGPTGLHASTEDEFAAGFAQVLLQMSPEERWKMRVRARRSARRFSGKAFEERWLVHMDRLMALRKQASK